MLRHPLRLTQTFPHRLGESDPHVMAGGRRCRHRETGGRARSWVSAVTAAPTTAAATSAASSHARRPVWLWFGAVLVYAFWNRCIFHVPMRLGRARRRFPRVTCGMLIKLY